MFAQNMKQVFGTCSVPFSGFGCVAHGTHLSQMEKICSIDFRGVCAAHTRMVDTTLRAEPELWLLIMWPWVTQERQFPKGKRRAQVGAAVPVCQPAEDAAGCSLLLCNPHTRPYTSAATLSWIPQVWTEPLWESATWGFRDWPQSPAANQSQGSTLNSFVVGLAWRVQGSWCPGNAADPGCRVLHF